MTIKPIKGDDLAQEELRELLEYHPDGYFLWRPRPKEAFNAEMAFYTWNGKWSGKRAGCKSHGYVLISIKRVQYPAHRLVWIYHYGRPPNGQIDHINHKRDDNRIENLREVNNQENNKNCPIRATNTSGVTGVYWNSQRRKWQAFITINGKVTSLGRFINKDEAIAARLSAAHKHGYHPNHGADR